MFFSVTMSQWVFPQRFFRENPKLGEGGEEGRDNDIVQETFERTGVSVMGKRMTVLDQPGRGTDLNGLCTVRRRPPPEIPGSHLHLA